MKIIVAVEEKTFACAIINCIETMSWGDKPEFKILSVVSPIKYKIPVVAGVADNRYIEVMEERRRCLKSLVLNVGLHIEQSVPHAKVHEIVVDGEAKQKILQLSAEWQADLIIMGSHSRSDLQRLFLGSTSLAVIANAPCSVLLVKLVQDRSQRFNNLC